MVIDLDGVKKVNDTLGHDIGDLLLRGVASRLQKCIRASDSVGRFGGDEFAIVLEDTAAPDDARRIAERIVAQYSEFFVMNRQPAKVCHYYFDLYAGKVPARVMSRSRPSNSSASSGVRTEVGSSKIRKRWFR